MAFRSSWAPRAAATSSRTAGCGSSGRSHGARPSRIMRAIRWSGSRKLVQTRERHRDQVYTFRATRGRYRCQDTRIRRPPRAAPRDCRVCWSAGQPLWQCRIRSSLHRAAWQSYPRPSRGHAVQFYVGVHKPAGSPLEGSDE